MEVKGTAPNALRELVRSKFNWRYDEWVNSLSNDGREIFAQKIILVNKWYPIEESLIEPLDKVCKLFYRDRKTGAWDYGRFIAEHDVKTIFRVFLRLKSPAYTINRAPIIFKSYFSLGEMQVIENSEHKAILHLAKFPKPHEIVEFAVGGWIERTLEIIGCREPRVKISQSLTKGDLGTEFVLQWS